MPKIHSLTCSIPCFSNPSSITQTETSNAGGKNCTTVLTHDFLCGSMGIPKHLSTRRQILIVKPRLVLQLVAAGFDLSLAVFSNCRFLDLFRVFIGLFSLVFVGKLALYFGFQPLANRPVCADQARSCVRPPECRSLGMRSNCAAFSNTLHRGASSSPLWW